MTPPNTNDRKGLDAARLKEAETLLKKVIEQWGIWDAMGEQGKIVTIVDGERVLVDAVDPQLYSKTCETGRLLNEIHHFLRKA